MKKLVLILCVLPCISFAVGQQPQADGPVFSSIDPQPVVDPRTTVNSAISATGFSASSNSADKDSEEDYNTHMKTSTHMGDVLNHKLSVFGNNLFGNQCSKLHQARFFNPQYRLTVGDEVNVQMWGAFQLAQKLPVDTQGNIFIPEVGPVRVDGIENQKLNEVIRRHVKKTFKKGVNVYADLVTAQPVQVYVTGFVSSPGLYDGVSSDSIIYFLCSAGGINLQEGSFRDIDVIREGREIRQVDLYDFLLKGNINTFQLHQGDTIVVNAQRHIVSVAGDVKNAYQYELTQREIPLHALMKLANVEPSAIYVRIQRNQGMKPTFIYQEIKASKPMSIQAGDRVIFVADKEVQQTVVTVKGQIQGPHQHVVKQGTTLDQFLKTLALTPQGSLENVQLYRESVARQQKEALGTSLARLQRQTMTGEALTGDDARSQATRSEMIMKFIQEAKQVETKGQVILGNPAEWHKFNLENNDVINIPPKSLVVTISGDVVNSISLTVNPQFRLIDYIQAAGGFQKSANQGEFLLMRQSGQVQLVKNTKWQNSHYPLKGGDQLVILPKETENGIKVTGMMTSILYQLAIAARVAMRI